jgi:signal transduction histidine kinase/ActR/RegA family two-component response regulator
LDAQVRNDDSMPGVGSAGMSPGWHAVSLALPSASDAMMGLVCLAMVALIAIGRRRDLRASSSRIVTGLVIVLVLCGAGQVARAIAGPPLQLAAMPMLAGTACWAAALSLRTRFGRATPAGITTAVGTPSAGETRTPAEEVDRLTDALRQSEAQIQELLEADARKNQFLAILGHELRNPLAPIRNALRIMKQSEPDDPDHTWAHDVVEHQLTQLKELVDDLLEVSRVTGGKVRLDREPTDVATIVAYAVETSRPTIEAHHHRLSIALPSRPLIVDADPNRMSQVLVNLLNNAAKYSADGGQIRLAVARDGNRVAFRVRDSGVGIPPEMLGRVFDLFAQVDQSLDRSQGGLGLGLTLVRSLVELHGGSVEARSDGPGQGSEFIVRLPVMTEAQARARAKPRLKADDRPSATSARPARRTELFEVATEDARSTTDADAAGGGAARRILVVDDNDTAAQSMAMILKLEGYEVQIAYDGETALQVARTFRPEAILSDIGLPGIDGHELARRIRQDPDLSASVAFLAAVTGYAEAEARRRSRESGFDHHLVKPVDPEAVLALLASLEWRSEALALETS